MKPSHSGKGGRGKEPDMKSKAEERTALKRIKDIVSEMGTTSYIGIALEGCLESQKATLTTTSLAA